MRATVGLLTVAFVLGVTATAVSHDWYSGLIAEDGALCCNSRDCHPVGHRNTQDKGLEIEIGNVWIPVSPKSVLQTTSLDASAHACYYYLIVDQCSIQTALRLGGGESRQRS